MAAEAFILYRRSSADMELAMNIHAVSVLELEFDSLHREVADDLADFRIIIANAPEYKNVQNCTGTVMDIQFPMEKICRDIEVT